MGLGIGLLKINTMQPMGTYNRGRPPWLATGMLSGPP
jgi:hypothetical protein